MALSHSSPESGGSVSSPLLNARQHRGRARFTRPRFVRSVQGFAEADADSDKLSQLDLLTLPSPKVTFARTVPGSVNIKVFKQRTKKILTEFLLL